MGPADSITMESQGAELMTPEEIKAAIREAKYDGKSCRRLNSEIDDTVDVETFRLLFNEVMNEDDEVIRGDDDD